MRLLLVHSATSQHNMYATIAKEYYLELDSYCIILNQHTATGSSRYPIYYVDGSICCIPYGHNSITNDVSAMPN